MTTRGVPAVAREEPDRVALVHGDRRTTFGELDAAANRWAQRFARAGVGHGDRVAVMLGNRPEIFACWYGAARIGALIVPLSYRFTSSEVAYLLADSEAAAFVYEDEAVAGPAAADVPTLRAAVAVDDREVERLASRPPTNEFLGTTAVFMNYTSGTTGKPKGIVRPLPVPAEEMGPQLFTEFWGFGRDDVHLLCGPAYHTAPGNYAVMHLNEGAPVVMMQRFDADECLRLIETERVTSSHMVPANFVRLLEVDWAAYDRSSVRKILHAAAPCPVPVKRRIMEVFPPGTVWEYFGMSEGYVTCISPEEWLEKPGSVGQPSLGVDVKILDEEGQELPAGEVGTIWVSAVPGYAFSYHKAEEKTKEAWRDGMFTVGDLGHLDEDNYLFIADRRVDLIISGGVNIYPAEVEQALAEHEDVVDSAVFGLPDERMGQRTFALVELRPGARPDEEALLAFLRTRLATYKLPREFEFTDELPREPSGKVLKRQLREARLPEG
ncbi:MAG TPA: AMP-binding protein [Acidimicrobiales bacterium]|nr:AMP-binding protein [Acidimicrobiales bacterium]